MNRSRILFFLTSSILVLFIVGGSMLGAAGREDEEDSLYKYLSVFTEVLSLVKQAYVEEVDLTALMDGAMDGATEAMDPFSLFLPEAEVERYARSREVGSKLSGLTLLKDRGIVFVAAVEPGSPAAKAGVKVSDIVAEINGESTRLMPVWEIQEILGGVPGSKVKLGLFSYGERSEITFELAAFSPPAAGLEIVDGALMLQIGGFRREGVAAVREALEKASLQGTDRLLVDLRGVAAGDPEVAYEIAGLFTSGELGRLDRRGEALATYSNDRPPLWRGRLVVLINRGTLGAAEILTAVLRQRIAAELVGERTFGYAGRQASVDLASGGRLIYTDAFYTGPDGELLRGSLEPDVRVSGTSRTFEERDLPASELILKRGIEHLLKEEEPPAARKAA